MIPQKVAVILGYIKKTNEPFLRNAVEALQRQTYKNLDVFVYDNLVGEDTLIEFKKDFPEVKVKRNSSNLGFAGGNNSVMREVIKDESYKYVALINDDTAAEPEWLENLVSRAETDSNIGAVASKLVFFEDYIRVSFLAEQSLKFYDATSIKQSAYTKKFYREGFLGIQDLGEGKFTLTESKFVIDLPIGKGSGKYELKLVLEAIEKEQDVEIKVGDLEKKIKIKPGKNEYVIDLDEKLVSKNKFTLIQNAGTGLTAQFNGFDRGNVQRAGTISSDAEIDSGQYDEAEPVDMFCGGAVLLNIEALKQVGIFDEYYFVYYEDTDLSRRIIRAGWKIIYEPKAVVRHMHATSSTEYSPLFVYHVAKNKPAFVLKNFGLRPSFFAIKELILVTCKSIYQVLRQGFKNSTLNRITFVYIKALCKFTVNMPVILLKKYNILKSN